MAETRIRTKEEQGEVQFDCGCWTLFWATDEGLVQGGSSCCKPHEDNGELTWVGKVVQSIRWPEKPILPVNPDARQGWLQQRLIEEREVSRKLTDRVAELEGNLRRYKTLTDELFPRNEPVADDTDV